MKQNRKSKNERLPDFIVPMQAKAGVPFNSEDYLFEVKWDGIRALAFVENQCLRLLNRRKTNMTARYPELGFLQNLPSGTVLDGELVVISDGRPDFGLLMSREQASSPIRIRQMSQSLPVIYVVFDILFQNHQSLMALPLQERCQRLSQLLKKCGSKRLVLSESIDGAHGKKFFQEAVRKGLEGVVAKRINSRYTPGQRTEDWIKIKRSEAILCAIIGFEPSGQKDFRSLYLATDRNGKLVATGKVGSGFNTKMRDRLNQLLWKTIRKQPWLSCKIKGHWVEPGLYCRVQFLERTSGGELRSPVFMELIEES